MNEKFPILICISQKFVPKGLIDNKSQLVPVIVSNRWQAINWTNADPIHGCIYVAPGGDEF